MYLCIPKKAAHRVLAAVLCAAAAGGVLLGLGRGRRQNPRLWLLLLMNGAFRFRRKTNRHSTNLSISCAPSMLLLRRREQKRLYLTFDAGYENGNTAPILDALKSTTPGTFFVVGSYIKENRT